MRTNLLGNVWNPSENFNFPKKKKKKNTATKTENFPITTIQTCKLLLYFKVEDSACCEMCILFAPNEVGIFSKPVYWLAG